LTTTSAREGMGGEMGIDAMADEALQEAYNHGCAHMAACTGAGTREAEMEHEAHAADARAALLAELARVEAERDAALAKVAAVRAECEAWARDLFTEAQHAYSQDEAGQHREDYNAIIEALDDGALLARIDKG